VWTDHILWQIRNAKARESCCQNWTGAVEVKLSFDPHVQLASMFLELIGSGGAAFGSPGVDGRYATLPLTKVW
jgi:hypothetical protein